MINTDTEIFKTNVQSLFTSNKLLNINQFVNANLAKMENHLTTAPTCNEYHSFQGIISLNNQGTMIITDRVPQPLHSYYAIKPQRTIEQKNLTIKEWATKLLINYAKWYNQQYTHQSKMSLTEIAKLLNRKTNTIMFSCPAYQGFVINNLDHLNPYQISLHYLEIDTFVNQLLSNYQSYSQLYASTLIYLTRNVIFHQTSLVAKVLEDKIFRTLVLREQGMPKLIFDITEENNSVYNDVLFELLRKHVNDKKHKIIFPLSAIAGFRNLTIYCQPEYHCFSKRDITNLIKFLVKIYQHSQLDYSDERKNFQLNISNPKSKIILGKYKDDLKQKMMVLKSNFAGITPFAEMAVALQRIIDRVE